MHTVARTSKNLQKCRCMDCPSYTTGCKVKNYPLHLLRVIDGIDNMEHYEAMFCAFGKSNCIHEDKGCLCENCEVFLENNLSKDEYCMSENGRNKYDSIFGFKKKNKKHDS